jgi:hypothetical protein
MQMQTDAPGGDAEIDVESEGGEGYYELNIKSVEAVRWRPESEDADGVDPEYKDV